MCGFLGELVLASGIVESPNDEEARESRVMQLDEKGDVAQKQVENQPRTSRHTHTHTHAHTHTSTHARRNTPAQSHLLYTPHHAHARYKEPRANNAGVTE